MVTTTSVQVWPLPIHFLTRMLKWQVWVAQLALTWKRCYKMKLISSLSFCANMDAFGLWRVSIYRESARFTWYSMTDSLFPFLITEQCTMLKPWLLSWASRLLLLSSYVMVFSLIEIAAITSTRLTESLPSQVSHYTIILHPPLCIVYHSNISCIATLFLLPIPSIPTFYHVEEHLERLSALKQKSHQRSWL